MKCGTAIPKTQPPPGCEQPGGDLQGADLEGRPGVSCAQRLLGRPSREGEPLTRRRHDAICERVMGTLPIPVTSVSSDAIVFFTPTSFRSFASCSRYERFVLI